VLNRAQRRIQDSKARKQDISSTRMKSSPALPDYDVAGHDVFAAKLLDTQILGVASTTCNERVSKNKLDQQSTTAKSNHFLTSQQPSLWQSERRGEANSGETVTRAATMQKGSVRRSLSKRRQAAIWPSA
jgi:hypothetical protein